MKRWFKCPWHITRPGRDTTGLTALTLSSAAGQLGGFNPATAVFSTSDGGGYWVGAANGAVYSFGDAPYLGGMNGSQLNAPVIAAAGW